ncbi:MAG: HlyD family efflux transporter periplasmic adaptor subunit [Gloeomargaritaceae cyanobacterium C42_A2020_066]|nr:HlyD family efflux transporter periplasmic adaptor subunit [Gloeomargaritaceae cyanobacterium C42_A2020_066]
MAPAPPPDSSDTPRPAGLALLPRWLGLGTRSYLAGRPAEVPAVPPPRPVELTQLRDGQPQLTLQLLGQVEALGQTTVRAQTAGVVTRIAVQPGDRVQTGTLLATLDAADQQVTLAEAEARLAQAQSELKAAQAQEQAAADQWVRTQQLVAEGALSERALVEARAAQDSARSERLRAAALLAEAEAGPRREEIDSQRAQVRAAQATVNQARLALSRTRMLATMAGRIQTRVVSVGDLVERGDPVFTLVSANALEAYLEVPETAAGRLQPQTSVSLTARSLPNWQGRGILVGILPAAEPSSRQQQVRVVILDPPPQLLSGMAIQGEIRQAMPAGRGLQVERDARTRRGKQWLI